MRLPSAYILGMVTSAPCLQTQHQDYKKLGTPSKHSTLKLSTCTEFVSSANIS